MCTLDAKTGNQKMHEGVRSRVELNVNSIVLVKYLVTVFNPNIWNDNRLMCA
jgi:hypothetical protein